MKVCGESVVTVCGEGMWRWCVMMRVCGEGV